MENLTEINQKVIIVGICVLLLLRLAGFTWSQALVVAAIVLVGRAFARTSVPILHENQDDAPLSSERLRFVPFALSIRADLDRAIEKLGIAKDIYLIAGKERLASLFATVTFLTYQDFSGFGPDTLMSIRQDGDLHGRFSTSLRLAWEVNEVDFGRSDYSTPDLNRAFPHLLRIKVEQRDGRLRLAIGYARKWAEATFQQSSSLLQNALGFSEFGYVYQEVSSCPINLVKCFTEVPSGSNPAAEVAKCVDITSAPVWRIDAESYPLTIESGVLDLLASPL